MLLKIMLYYTLKYL